MIDPIDNLIWESIRIEKRAEKNAAVLGIISLSLALLGLGGYVATAIGWSMPGKHGTPSTLILPIASILCGLGAIIAGALRLKPARALNIIGLFVGGCVVVVLGVGLAKIFVLGL